jgi:threonylcarbamoyladenosine tRNA methylthiotransferase MtaB
MAPKYAIVTFGCRVNQADSLRFEEELRAGGAVASTAEAADLVIVNTCSVTATADQGARQTIRRVARHNPHARIVVTGCYATRRPDEVAALPHVACVVANDDKPRLISLLRRSSDYAERPDETTAERFGDGDGSCGAAIQPGVAGRTAFTLRVQTGCAEPCSYCIIPTTRGRPRSVSIAGVVREVERIAAAGFKEIAITGVHLGSYGRDLDPRSTLLDLLRALDHVHATPPTDGGGDILFRISSLEPMDCSREMVDLVASSYHFAAHFHLPLQHASNRVLAAMRRPYTIEHYAALVDDIRGRIPHASIGTDVIVGFPGESDGDFDELAEYLSRSPLTHVHVFPYSDRPGTQASAMPGKVHGAVVRERVGRIKHIAQELTQRFRDAQIGTTHRALTLEDGSLVVTGNYLKVRIPPGRPRNEWVRVRITSQHDGELLGGGAALSLDDQLSTGRANIPTAAFPDRDSQAMVRENLREPVDRLV